MKKLAILTCLQANDVCAGVSCLEALAARRGGFIPYAGQEVQLCAFLRCSHCGANPTEDPGMLEKLERIASCGVDAAHVGVCAQKKNGARCPQMAQAAAWLEARGIEVVWRTH